MSCMILFCFIICIRDLFYFIVFFSFFFFELITHVSPVQLITQFFLATIFIKFEHDIVEINDTDVA